jgi:hypothetical protein
MGPSELFTWTGCLNQRFPNCVSRNHGGIGEEISMAAEFSLLAFMNSLVTCSDAARIPLKCVCRKSQWFTVKTFIHCAGRKERGSTTSVHSTWHYTDKKALNQKKIVHISEHYKGQFLGAFTKFRKATISFVPFVCPSVWSSWSPTGLICMKSDIPVFFENMPRNFQLWLKSDKNARIMGTLREQLIMGTLREHLIMGTLREHLIMDTLREHLIMGTSREHLIMGTLREHLIILTFMNPCMKVTNKMQLYRLIHFSLSALHVSGDVFAHHQEYLFVFTVSGSIHAGCCLLLNWMSWNCFAVSTHPRHKPAATWVNTTRYCKYSQVLLMMGENIARNT